MKFIQSCLIGMLLAALGSVSAITTAVAADVGIYLNTAPPPREEHVPPPREGYVWIQGYWDVKHNHPEWRSGHWERERHGYHYAQPTWTERNNRWELQRGHWEHGEHEDHDRDHDRRE